MILVYRAWVGVALLLLHWLLCWRLRLPQGICCSDKGSSSNTEVLLNETLKPTQLLLLHSSYYIPPTTTLLLLLHSSYYIPPTRLLTPLLVILWFR